MKNILCLIFGAFIVLVGCQSEPRKTIPETPLIAVPLKKVVTKKVMADAATILSKKEVPILCYHNIRDFSASASGNIKVYTVKPSAFAEQMEALADAGYETILPEQLYDYLVYDGPLPAKPIMITFDDTREEQFSIGAAEMRKYGFKGVFFIMTVSINRPGYMSKEQIKSLSDNGHLVGAHTWDHHMVTKYTGDDWNTQLVKPKAKLEDIIGKPVKDFAYPFGLWNTAAIPEIKKSNYKMAYILSTKRDSIDPLYTIRRIIVSGTWSTEGMMKAINSSFNKTE
ncbi:polysaccharide deacetylase family protein [Flavobacterium sp. XS2P24]|uniref:polysaccharide deacetylase family protein n=1 Tax=Flavobacterium sp. XS2P24 TaxID=3041249 RepID=UPI0024A84FFA|nr:polysaccharide deacetylase family protein [Flavobacterium sp. XS2P24]MDI6048410.1 polysaccharide deacetylase family protein [Flavobacterium sp. XS2P24]